MTDDIHNTCVHQDRDTGINTTRNIRTNKEQISISTEMGSEKRPAGPGKCYIYAGISLDKPLGQSLGASNFKGRPISSGNLAGIHNDLVAVTPFTKRRTKGSRGILVTCRKS